MTQNRTSLEQGPYQENMDGMRRYYAQQFEVVYMRASKKVGKELEFSSSRHLFAGLSGLLLDSTYTLWNPVRSVLNSPGLKEACEGKTLLEFISEKVKSEDTKKNKNIRKQIEDVYDHFDIAEKFVQNLAARCRQTNRTPEVVLKSAANRLDLIEKSYGSLEKYTKNTTKSIKNTFKLLVKMKKFEKAPIAPVIGGLITHQIDELELEEFGLDARVLGNIAQSYIRDAVKFGQVYLAEYSKHRADELAEYQALKSKR